MKLTYLPKKDGRRSLPAHRRLCLGQKCDALLLFKYGCDARIDELTRAREPFVKEVRAIIRASLSRRPGMVFTKKLLYIR